MASGYELDLRNGKWRELTSMIEPRRDHACLYIDLEETDGILVTGMAAFINHVDRFLVRPSSKPCELLKTPLDPPDL